MLDKIIFPIILISAKNSLEVVNCSDQLKHITTLAFNEKSLIGSTIFDSNNYTYKVSDVVKISNLNKWWKFEFFNPMLNIDIVLDDCNITFSNAKEIIEKAINSYPDFWDSYDLQELIVTIEKHTKMSEIIKFLKDIRGIR